ncbi:MAG: choice-of-anchor D domain-containing protein, partial [Porticoccaceae bacterium]
MHQTTRLQPLPGPLDGICHHALNMAITAVLLAGALSSEARAQAFPAVIDLGSLSGNDGFRLDGAAAYDVSGFSVSAAGDINGDGIDDLIVGAPYADPNGSASGSSYVVFGKDAANAGNFPATLALSSLNGSDGFRLDGAAAGDGSGRSVSAAGDLNGDGIDDLIVGAYGADPNGVTSGSSYVVFGKNSPFAATLALGSLSGADGFRLDGAAAYDRSGRSVGAAGDINGDGFGDLLVGAFGADPNGDYSGSSYVVLGKATPFTATLALSSLNGSNGFRLDGVATIDFSGLSVGAAGDINGDGLDDLIVGAPYADPNGSDSGSSYVLFGKDTPFTANLALSSLNGSDGFRLDGVAAFDYAGRSVSAAGDINGDGIDDLIVGALGADPNGSTSGSSYVVFGKETALLGDFPATLALSSLNGSNGYRLDGASAFDRSGRSVSAAGDLNGDGIDDLIVGAFRADPNGNTSGSSYVAFGRDTATQGDFPATLELSSLNGPSGFRLDGAVAFDYSGFSVSAAGDINGDGIDDLIVGAYRADPNGDASGSSYVVFGRVTGLPSLDFGGQKLVDFGPVFVGSTAAAQTLTLSNPGSGRVQIDSIVISNAQFALVGGSCGSLPIRIRVGENCTLDVQFMPQTAGPVLAQMTFTSTSVTSPDSITLFGTGLPAPALSLMPDPLDFGEVAVGASGSAMLIVENTGAGTLQPGLVTIGGADA